MKRMICFLLVGILMITLCACSQETKDSQILFYYPRAEYKHGTPDGVITPEIHEISGHNDDLRYLLALYLQGPSDPELRLPFPGGTTLVDMVQDEQQVTITLSSTAALLEGIDLTIACACLAQTSFAVCDVPQVRIQSQASTSGRLIDITFTRDNILLPGYEILPENPE